MPARTNTIKGLPYKGCMEKLQASGLP